MKKNQTFNGLSIVFYSLFIAFTQKMDIPDIIINTCHCFSIVEITEKSESLGISNQCLCIITPISISISKNIDKLKFFYSKKALFAYLRTLESLENVR